MIVGRRRRDRAFIGLGILLGLIFGALPAADACPMRSGTSPAGLDAPEPTAPQHRCCQAGLAPASPPVLPTRAPSGPAADGSCPTRTSCCCVAGNAQAVADRAARSGVSRAESRSSEALGLAEAIARPATSSPSLLIAAGPPRPGPSRVPRNLRTARLRN
jgi:hypothetical protein